MTLLFIASLIYRYYFKYRDFKLIKATVRFWKRIANEEVTTYQIQLQTKKSSEEMVFEELYIDEKRYKLKLSNSNRRIVSRFGKKEIVNLNVFSQYENSASQPSPEEKILEKGEAILSYFVGTKRKSLSIKKFDENLKGFFLLP